MLLGRVTGASRCFPGGPGTGRPRRTRKTKARSCDRADGARTPFPFAREQYHCPARCQPSGDGRPGLFQGWRPKHGRPTDEGGRSPRRVRRTGQPTVMSPAKNAENAKERTEERPEPSAFYAIYALSAVKRRIDEWSCRPRVRGGRPSRWGTTGDRAKRPLPKRRNASPLCSSYYYRSSFCSVGKFPGTAAM